MVEKLYKNDDNIYLLKKMESKWKIALCVFMILFFILITAFLVLYFEGYIVFKSKNDICLKTSNTNNTTV